METKFIGEHLLPGQLGHFFVILAFISSIVATVAYFISTNSKDTALSLSWKRLARTAFFIQVGAVLSVFGLLYFLISHHYFEYAYVWEHSSRELSPKYLLSCFWEGQEGSFLLWTVWHCVLGSILIFTAKKWEAPVMTVISFAQICLASMLLGIYFFGYKVGSSPFILFREANPGMPLFQRADYMSFISDGHGLNPLLQNYWMVIHPPILFCGFASTIVPFAFAFAGLWKKNFSEWVKPALPWVLFSGMVLGTGVMMGAAWAYESLTFGGFWAWDPVENAILVPWLTLIAGLHTLLVYKHTGHSLRATFFFFIITFILILYSTFLTRSGILGTTSVHAFTDLGMSGQLLVYLFIFLIPAFLLFFINFRRIPNLKKEENIDSREFWMFIGALVLLLSAVFITFTTSIPVWNKLFNLNLAPPVDQKFHYNKVQIFVAVILGVGTAAVQYLRYRNTPAKFFGKKIIIPTVIALFLGTLLAIFGKVNFRDHGMGFLVAIYVAMFTSVYAIVANFSYVLITLKGKIKAAGASIAHVGFGMMLLGILISTSRQKAISLDHMGLLDGYFRKDDKEFATARENIFLSKNLPMQMGEYWVTYLGDSTSKNDPKHYYKVNYQVKDKSGKVLTAFNLYPDAFINPKGQEGLIANPGSKHYWDHDVFTYVTSVPDPSKIKDTGKYESHVIQPGDTIFLSNGYMVLDGFTSNPVGPGYEPKPGDIAVGAKLSIHTGNNETFSADPIYYLRDSSYQYSVEDTIPQLNLYVKFDKILPEQKKVQLSVKQSDTVGDYIVLKAFVFPFINVLWLGTLVMIIGFLISIVHRVRQQGAGKEL